MFDKRKRDSKKENFEKLQSFNSCKDNILILYFAHNILKETGFKFVHLKLVDERYFKKYFIYVWDTG